MTVRHHVTISLACLFATACGGGSSAVDAGDDSAVTDAGTDAAARDLGTDAGPPPPITRPALPATNALPTTDPNYQGQLRFLYDTWGVEVNDSWPTPEFMLGLMTSEPAVFGNQFASFGFVHDPNDDFPVGLKRGISDPTKLGQTCALCHVAQLADGRVWLGAANTGLRLEEFRVELSHRWVAAGHPALLTPLEETKAAGLGPGRANAEGGDNPQLVAADYPPYYNFQNRTTFTYLGAVSDLRSTVFVTIFDSGARTPYDPMALAPWPGDARPQLMVDFLNTVVGPDGPAQDPTMVARGQTVFTTAQCNSCHHVGTPAMDGIVQYSPDGVERMPGDDPAYPRGTIATDRLDFDLINYMGTTMGTDPEILLRLRFLTGHGLHFGLSDGYRALGMKSVWAAPPYLHNGSVPTLEDLLKPAAMRPATFVRGPFTVDTTVAGNGNMGHEFGTTLSDADKTALVAYLRSL